MKNIVVLSLPPAHGVDVMGPLEVFALASRMLAEETGRPGYDSLDAIADRCGFSSAELLRRCFLRHFKIPPRQYRKHLHPPAATPGAAAGRAGPSLSMASR